MMFRLFPETPQEPFALWEILNKSNEPLVGLLLDSKYACFLIFAFIFFFFYYLVDIK